MRHRIANVGDSEILGELNHQLIKDEGHRNSMAIPELVERMRGWLMTDYRASVPVWVTPSFGRCCKNHE